MIFIGCLKANQQLEKLVRTHGQTHSLTHSQAPLLDPRALQSNAGAKNKNIIIGNNKNIMDNTNDQ